MGSRSPSGIDADLLDRELAAAFGGSPGARRAVVRAASDLADDGSLAEDRGHPLTVGVVLDELDQAPDGGPADRWNWWIGALETAYGGYAQFGVNRYRADPDEDADGDDTPGDADDGADR